MAKKCKYCFSAIVSPDAAICPVCKIAPSKDKKQLTPQEIKIWYAARNLHLAGFFAILMGVLGLVIWSISLTSGSKAISTFTILLNLLLAATSLWVGVALQKHQKWSYVAGIVLFAVSLTLHFLAGRLFGVFITAVFIYCIANPTAKKILYRQL